MPHQKSEDGYLSVTEVLSLSIPKPYLCRWYGKNGTAKCEQIKRDSQELGTDVHRMIESMFNNVVPSGSDNALRMLQNFNSKFVQPYDVKPLSLEETLKDTKLKLQGTYDAIVSTNKGVFIADWKTSNQLDKQSVPLQLSMYAYMYNSTDYGIINQGVAVRIDKEKDTVQIKWYTDLDQYNKIWKACIRVARWNKYGIEGK